MLDGGRAKRVLYGRTAPSGECTCGKRQNAEEHEHVEDVKPPVFIEQKVYVPPPAPQPETKTYVAPPAPQPETKTYVAPQTEQKSFNPMPPSSEGVVIQSQQQAAPTDEVAKVRQDVVENKAPQGGQGAAPMPSTQLIANTVSPSAPTTEVAQTAQPLAPGQKPDQHINDAALPNAPLDDQPRPMTEKSASGILFGPKFKNAGVVNLPLQTPSAGALRFSVEWTPSHVVINGMEDGTHIYMNGEDMSASGRWENGSFLVPRRSGDVVASLVSPRGEFIGDYNVADFGNGIAMQRHNDGGASASRRTKGGSGIVAASFEQCLSIYNDLPLEERRYIDDQMRGQLRSAQSDSMFCDIVMIARDRAARFSRCTVAYNMLGVVARTRITGGMAGVAAGPGYAARFCDLVHDASPSTATQPSGTPATDAMTEDDCSSAHGRWDNNACYDRDEAGADGEVPGATAPDEACLANRAFQQCRSNSQGTNAECMQQHCRAGSRPEHDALDYIGGIGNIAIRGLGAFLDHDIRTRAVELHERQMMLDDQFRRAQLAATNDPANREARAHELELRAQMSDNQRQSAELANRAQQSLASQNRPAPPMQPEQKLYAGLPLVAWGGIAVGTLALGYAVMQYRNQGQSHGGGYQGGNNYQGGGNQGGNQQGGQNQNDRGYNGGR